METGELPEEFMDFRKVIEKAEFGLQTLLPDFQAARDALLETGAQIRSSIRMTAAWIRLRGKAQALLEAAGGFLEDYRDQVLEWAGGVRDFMEGTGLDPDSWKGFLFP